MDPEGRVGGGAVPGLGGRDCILDHGMVFLTLEAEPVPTSQPPRCPQTNGPDAEEYKPWASSN